MGLRTRLTIFTGIFLALLVSVIVAAAHKQQERVFADRVERETSPYFLPARKQVVESAHLEKNLIRLEQYKIRNGINRVRYEANPIFSERFSFGDEIYTAGLKNQEAVSSESDQKNFEDLVTIAHYAAVNTNNVYFKVNAAALQNRILINADFFDLYLKSLTGLDRRVFRIQALDREGIIRALRERADTWAISDTYNNAPINQFEVALPVPPEAIYTTGAGVINQAGHQFVSLTASVPRNEELGYRAKAVLISFHRGQLGGVLNIDKKYSKMLHDLFEKLSKREDELLLRNTPLLPAYDSEWISLAAAYAKMLKDRKEASRKALDRATQISGYTHEEIEDAVENLRWAALDSDMLLRYNYSAYARGYSGRMDWRKDFENRYEYLRKWIFSGSVETAYPYPLAANAEFLLLNRRDAFRRMDEINSLPLNDLAEKSLMAESAGYFRVLVDSAPFEANRIHERDRIFDISFAFGIRMFFLAALLSGFLVRRIRTIIHAASQISGGNLNVTFAISGSDEVGVLARSLNRMVEGLREREELRGEMSAAEEIQKRLLPEKLPDNLSDTLTFATFYKAMMGVGGDYFDVLESDKDSIAFCIADVSNHGAGPAIIMTMLRSHLHGLVRRKNDVTAIMRKLNARMYEDIPANVFITMFLGIYNGRTHSINAVNAGHVKSLVYRYRTMKVEEFDSTTLPIASVDSGMFNSVVATQTISLAQGDLFLQYTDGITEAMNSSEEEFGMERLRSMLLLHGRKKPVVLLHKIGMEVESFTGKKVFGTGPSEQKDDIAMIAFRRIK